MAENKHMWPWTLQQFFPRVHSSTQRLWSERYNVFFFFSLGIEYGWGIADTGKNSSFICEIPLSEVYKIGGEARDFGKSWHLVQ